jgi:hypothetical protein
MSILLSPAAKRRPRCSEASGGKDRHDYTESAGHADAEAIDQRLGHGCHDDDRHSQL